MSIRFENGKWVIDYYPYPGKRVQRVIPDAFQGSREEAQLYHDYVVESRKKEPGLPTGKTVKDLYPIFLQHMKMHMSAATRYDMERAFKTRLLPFFGKMEFETIGLPHIRLYQQARKGDKKKNGEPVSNKTVNKEVVYLRSFFRFASEELKACAPLPRIKMLKYVRPQPKVLSFDEISGIIRAADLFHRCYFMLLYILGMRLKEAAYTRWQDISWETRTIFIKEGKWGKPRALPIDGWVYESLREHWDASKRPAEGFVFPSRRAPGKPVLDIRKSLATACAKAGVEQRVYPHLLRHSGATQMLVNGSDLRTVQEMLGHNSIDVTQFYTHLNTEHIRKGLVNITK